MLACWGAELMARAISLHTRALFGPQEWPGPAWLKLAPSHVAQVVRSPRHGLILVESTTLCRSPCLIKGLHCSGAQAHVIEERIADYTAGGGQVVLYRLLPIVQEYFDADKHAHILIERFVRPGIGYDYPGAILSGTRKLKMLPQFGADLNHVFCSEMLAHADMLLGVMNWANPTRYNPGSYVRRQLRTGVRKHTPILNLKGAE